MKKFTDTYLSMKIHLDADLSLNFKHYKWSRKRTALKFTALKIFPREISLTYLSAIFQDKFRLQRHNRDLW